MKNLFYNNKIMKTKKIIILFLFIFTLLFFYFFNSIEKGVNNSSYKNIEKNYEKINIVKTNFNNIKKNKELTKEDFYKIKIPKDF
jgi:predicted RND superfamily exporter protein